MIQVEVAYAKPHEQVIFSVQVPAETTVEMAIELSGILLRFAEINLDTIQVGIFGKPVSLATKLNCGDRVEIYRPLQVDPKTARRLRAKI